MKHFSVNKKRGFSVKRGEGNSVNEGFGKDFYRKGNSAKRFGPFSEPPDSENWKVAVLIPFPKISSYYTLLSIPSKWTRKVWVANCYWAPDNPWKVHAGYFDSISQNAKPASTFELSACRHCKERPTGLGEAFGPKNGWPPAVCPPKRPQPFTHYSCC